MINKNIITEFLKEKNYKLQDGKTDGITIVSNENEIVVKGSKLDLLELANYIVSVSLSENDKDHIHIDDLTLLNKNSKIANLIIEKE